MHSCFIELIVACQKIVQSRLNASSSSSSALNVAAGRSNTPNHINAAAAAAVRNYHSQQSCPPPLPPYPVSHGGGGPGSRSYDVQSHSSTGSGTAMAPLTPTGMVTGHHAQVDYDN